MFGFGGPKRPKVVAFDVIGTVFPLEPLRPAMVALGLPPAALEGWFAAGLVTAYVSAERPFPRTMRQPDVQAPTLAAAARKLAAP